MTLPAMTIDGDVVAIHSHWTGDHSRIVTEAMVHTSDGTDVIVSQLGGSVDGIGMIQMPGPPILVPGMIVALAAHRDVDLAQAEHVVLDSVKVMAYPPNYVRARAMRYEHLLYWESGCVFVTVDAAGTTAIPGDGEFPIIDASIDTWNNDTSSCSYLTVMSDGRKPIEVGHDKVNVIKFRDTSWCRPATADDPAHCYEPLAAGITNLFYVDDDTSDRNGAILDADIEINGVNFAISVNGQTNSNPTLCKAELQNTLTHELGHLHGLEHTCYIGTNPMWVDNLGNPVPACRPGLDPPQIANSTMYPTQTCGEVSKEMLSPDDIQAICEIYPTNQDPNTCDHVRTHSGGCCSASGPGSDRPWASLLLAGWTVLLVLRGRKTRRAMRGDRISYGLLAHPVPRIPRSAHPVPRASPDPPGSARSPRPAVG
jgi:hypothetical protein